MKKLIAAVLSSAPQPADQPAPKRRRTCSAGGAHPSPAPAPEAKAARSADSPIRTRSSPRAWKRALEGEAKIQAAAIDVTAADGKVTLWGTAGERR